MTTRTAQCAFGRVRVIVDNEPIRPIGWFVIAGLFGRKDPRADLRAGMGQTLERMGAVAERSVS